MPFFLKLLISNIIIVLCAKTGSRYPSFGGLIATMPLTSLLVLLWLNSDHHGNTSLLTRYTHGALWGIIPTILFFTAVHLCLRKGLSFPPALLIASLTWAAGAFVHQILMK